MTSSTMFSYSFTVSADAGVTVPNTNYKLVHNDEYKKTPSTYEERMCRSIVLNAENGTLMAFSPPSTIPYNPDLETVLCTEMMEGTLINLFYDHERGEWEIFTRTRIGADNSFYRTQYDLDHGNDKLVMVGYPQLTYCDMFKHTLGLQSFNSLNDSIYIANLPKENTYCFILQHPNNTLTIHHVQPRLILVAVYTIKENVVSMLNFDTYVQYLMPSVPVFLPRKFDEIDVNLTGVGLIVYYSNGERSAVMNPNYEKLREFRGNHPNLHYQFLLLKKTKQIGEYIKMFPWITEYFNEFQAQYVAVINNVHQTFIEKFVMRKNKVFPKKYNVLADRIQRQIYLPFLKAQKGKVTKNVVEEYFLSLNTKDLLYFMNYDYYANKRNNIA